MYKIEKIFKVHDELPSQLSGYRFEEFLAKHIQDFPIEGTFKFTISYRVGKRRKLKKVKVNFYNLHTCDCCGSYYIGEVL